MRRTRRIFTAFLCTILLSGIILAQPLQVSAASSRTGWQRNQAGQWLYYNNRNVPATGWLKVNRVWYFLDRQGIMQTGWVLLNGSWYYLENSGAMKTGWVFWRGAWYYLKESGAMAVGWQKDKGEWYYLRAGGAMATGMLTLGKDTYYLKPGSGAMHTGWLEYEGKKYYFRSNGDMVKGGRYTINKVRHEFDENGVWIDPDVQATQNTQQNDQQQNNTQQNNQQNGQQNEQQQGGQAPSEQLPTGNSNADIIERAIANATVAAGTPYVWSGIGLDGFDCSGLVYWCYKNAGLNWWRESSESMYTTALKGNGPFQVVDAAPKGKATIKIDYSRLKRGDLLLFRTNASRDATYGITHVIMYTGEQGSWHASSGYNRVELRPIEWFTSNYGFGYKGAIRLK